MNDHLPTEPDVSDQPRPVVWGPPPSRWSRKAALITAAVAVTVGLGAGTVLAHAGGEQNFATAACTGMADSLDQVRAEDPEMVNSDLREAAALTRLAQQNPKAPSDVRLALLVLSENTTYKPSDREPTPDVSNTGDFATDLANNLTAALPDILKSAGESLDRIQGHIDDLEAACTAAGAPFVFPSQDILLHDTEHMDDDLQSQ